MLNSVKQRASDTLQFLQIFAKNPASIGAIVPSSKGLANAMLAGLSFDCNSAVLELGPGTGVLTKELQSSLSNPNQYLGIECEEKFIHLLQQRYPDLRFINGRAEDAYEIGCSHGLATPDIILSGIPFSMLRQECQDQIINNLAKLMTPGSLFRTFVYVTAFQLPSIRYFRQQMDKQFCDYHRSRILLKNLPPAYILTWVVN